MATPWIDKVKTSKQLTVFPTSAVTRGIWASVFTKALQEFNQLSTTMKLGVTLVPSTTAPETNGLGGADVNFDVASGQVSFTVLGSDFSLNVIGEGMSAHTQVVKLEDDKKVRRVIKAFIFLPGTPMINSGPAGRQIRRLIGDGAKLFLAVHEFIHACGWITPSTARRTTQMYSSLNLNPLPAGRLRTTSSGFDWTPHPHCWRPPLRSRPGRRA
jgi:hypothetical protein